MSRNAGKRVVVVGTGIAGLAAALRAHRRGHRVTLLTKSRPTESNTRYAQGGVAVVGSPDDSVAEHVADTMAAGAGLCDRTAVEVLCAEGPDAVARLIDDGVVFDLTDGRLARGLEAAHSHPRVLHAGGDATGAAIAAGLLERVRAIGVPMVAGTTVTDLVLDERGRVVGVRLLDGRTMNADVVILATGGAGHLFAHTTNPQVATADGIAIALRAGAVGADLEFYQFHPTALALPGSHLISEAVRGEGAVLRDVDGNRFMAAVHPDAELAPRDIVARGIAAQMSRQGGAPVRLDATALGTDFLRRRFPGLDAAVRERGLDWSTEPIPVAPAAHYYMGGVRTDVWGRTNVPGLLVVGEAACTGLHGANRLASNSLLEGAVYGVRVVEGLDLELPDPVFDASWSKPISVPTEVAGAEPFNRSDFQRVMWDGAGVLRSGEGLRAAAGELAMFAPVDVNDAKSAEDANLLLVGRALVASALARESSRGAHHRADFPELRAEYRRHSGLLLERN